MTYTMHRVFCAAAWDLESEREAFLGVIGDFNETQAMQHGVLFVPVTLAWHTQDKTPIQQTLDQNIRACRYYVQVIEDTWGPPQSFEREKSSPFLNLSSTCSAFFFSSLVASGLASWGRGMSIYRSFT